MFTHNLDPILFEVGFLSVRWYSLAYIFGILLGWWYGRLIVVKKFSSSENKVNLNIFDDLITYIIISIIIGGRLGYILFYNFEYFLNNPIEIFKIWKGGMSFHGAMIAIVIGTYIFSKRRNIKAFFLLDIIACVSPIGIFLGRIANFINGELIGKVTNVFWSVIFPKVDNLTRHPSQLYEAFFEGLILFLLMNYVLFRKKYKVGNCSSLFLIFYGILRIFSEFFREPDLQIGYIYGFLSMGMMLSTFMIFIGTILYFKR